MEPLSGQDDINCTQNEQGQNWRFDTRHYEQMMIDNENGNKSTETEMDSRNYVHDVHVVSNYPDIVISGDESCNGFENLPQSEPVIQTPGSGQKRKSMTQTLDDPELGQMIKQQCIDDEVADQLLDKFGCFKVCKIEDGTKPTSRPTSHNFLQVSDENIDRTAVPLSPKLSPGKILKAKRHLSGKSDGIPTQAPILTPTATNITVENDIQSVARKLEF